MVAYQHNQSHIHDVINGWKNDFENLFINSTKTHYDDNHLGDTKVQHLHDDTTCSLDTNISLLNATINRQEVEHSLYTAKLDHCSCLIEIIN